jgi:hypothetical protein
MSTPNVKDTKRSHQASAGDGEARVQEPGIGHNVWFMTNGLSPIAATLARRLIDQGDCVTLGVLPEELKGSGSADLKILIDALQGNGAVGDSPDKQDSGSEDEDRKDIVDGNWRQRFRILPLDAR